MTLGSATRRGKKTKIEETCPPFEPFERPFGCCYVLEENKRVKKKTKKKKKNEKQREPLEGRKAGNIFSTYTKRSYPFLLDRARRICGVMRKRENIYLIMGICLEDMYIQQEHYFTMVYSLLKW